VEQATANLINVWQKPKKGEKKREWYSEEKLSYYFFKMMNCIEYLHWKNIFYSDMNEDNVLIFRTWRSKLGILGFR
jgi:hypothetical protein